MNFSIHFAGKHLLRFIVPAAALVLAGCSSSPVKKDRFLEHAPRKQVQRVAYNGSPDVAATQAKTMLVGQVHIHDRVNGGVRTGAYLDVVLNPVSAASNQWYQEVCRAGKVLNGQPDQRYVRNAFQAKTNDYGQFVFTNVPVGEYYLTSRLYWIDTKPISGPVEYGGLLSKKISLVAGTNAFDLNDTDKCHGYFH